MDRIGPMRIGPLAREWVTAIIYVMPKGRIDPPQDSVAV